MTDTEKKVMDVWKEVFEKDDIGLDDNFFEIGGDSIKAMRIYTALIERIAEVEIEDFYEAQTVREISKKIDDGRLWKEN